MKKICFYSRADRLFFYVPIAKKFEKNPEYDLFFITETQDETDFVIRNFDKPRVYSLYKWLDSHSYEDKEKYLDDIDNKYKDYCFWRLLYSDRFLINYDYEKCVSILIGHVLFFENVFSIEKPNCFLDEAIATFGSYIAYVVAKNIGCKYVGSIIDRTNPYAKFFAFENDYQLSERMQMRYKTNNFTTEGIKRANEYYDEFTKTDLKPAYMEKDKVPHFTIKCLFSPISYFFRRIKMHKSQYNNPNHYIEYKRPWNDRVYMDIERWIRFKMARKYYSEPQNGEKYYLFPLHFQPEATTLTCAEKYEKQIIAIDHIAKSIPLHTVLYVKEHYACLGHRHIEFYKQLKQYPNVKLITPFTNIHELIRESEAVVVLTSTAGFESIIHRKKVFVLGNVFYQFSKNATKLNDVYDEWKELRNIEADTSDGEVIRFLSAYFSEIQDGNIMYESPDYNSKKNIDTLYASYIKVLEKLEV